MKHLSLLFTFLFLFESGLQAEERIHYTGKELADPQFHHGRLSPAIGIHNIQVMRANREYPSEANGNGWTYNHQPMLAYWNGTFYLHYLSNPIDEHVPPSRTLLITSTNGYDWSNPTVLFPTYPVPDGFTKEGYAPAKNLEAVMHQRSGFYISKEGVLLALGNYGIVLDRKDDPNDGNGIGRVVRRIHADGSFGPIHFIYYNHQFHEKNTEYPYFERSKDKAFVKACRELLANPRQRMSWVEEADRNDPIIPLNKPYKAYCDYTLPDGRIVALWKHALTSISNNGGNHWDEPIERAEGFVNSNAKIWGQRLSDGSYATVYNPSEYRWPLAISLSSDGLEYTTLNLVHGEITPMRYGGNYKSYGPQYVRGIQEGNGTPPDGDLWITYSMNKEDMWVSHIPVPVRSQATAHAQDNFASCHSLTELKEWNIYSLLEAPVRLEDEWLVMEDQDRFDYARIERKIPPTKELSVAFNLMAGQDSCGTLHIEFLDENGTACSRLELTSEGLFRLKAGARFKNLKSYQAGKNYRIEARLSVKKRMIEVYINGQKAGQRMFFAPVESIERILFRTGTPRTHPTIDTPADWYGTLPQAGEKEPLCSYRIANFQTADTDSATATSLLQFNDFRHYVEKFNRMEKENIVQAIPNAQAAEWMQANIPLFECPDKSIEELFYYRWWTLRKHIKETPVGYAMTEFLVKRSYADKYNLISCALGHHIYESRWLHQKHYLDQIIHTWYRGNDGKPMEKMMKFSSWNIDALWARFLVEDNKAFLLDMLPDLIAEYGRWESSHRLLSGLYWQADVQDGMEESISGGRGKQYARPSINSYMYGNAKALERLCLLAGKEKEAHLYRQKADTLKKLIQDKLWNTEHCFFETLREDSLANVREAIGYLPWYFNLPDNHPIYEEAWKETYSKKGFLAPYGLTTAERRHPDFRTHGVGKCEWDGAVWPFATAQTLTAMANFINNYNAQGTLRDSIYFLHFKRYAQCQSHRGIPYIGEYLDETTGYWLKGDQERSKYYNHSTFNDLLITGVIGLRPRADQTIEVNPLLPENEWEWFCLDNINYHNHRLTIYWDRYGNRYHQGKGLHILIDGKHVGHTDTLNRIILEKILNK